jgi:hypothetical protein
MAPVSLPPESEGLEPVETHFVVAHSSQLGAVMVHIDPSGHEGQAGECGFTLLAALEEGAGWGEGGIHGVEKHDGRGRKDEDIDKADQRQGMCKIK